MLTRWLSRRVNANFAKVGLRVDYLARDFDSRPLDTFSRRKMFKALAEVCQSWLERQELFNVIETFDVGEAVEQFFENWLATPFREQQGGSRFNNLLWLFLIARSYRPDVIVDSGTFQGASAWALASGCPTADVCSFDIDLSQLRLRHASVKYIEKDWTTAVEKIGPEARSLVYFDDHVDQVRRLLEAGERGFQLAVFDDDLPVTSFYLMAASASVLPKIEFALDDDLVDGQTIEWTTRNGKQSWTVAASYLERGRAMIAATERLPNTSLITGIHQTPYRVITLVG